MKLETLRQVLIRQARIKLFISTDELCLCTYVSQPWPTVDGIVLATDSSLRVAFADGKVEFDAFGTGPFALRVSDRFTRRIETHRRHLEGRPVPAGYFARASQL